MEAGSEVEVRRVAYELADLAAADEYRDLGRVKPATAWNFRRAFEAYQVAVMFEPDEDLDERDLSLRGLIELRQPVSRVRVA